MLKKSSIYSAIIIIAGFTVACDKVEPPFTEEGVYINTGRKVLVEDYTGHKCGNCPGAHKVLEEILESVYGDQVIPVGVHIGAFAEPDNFFTSDFRTQAGNDLDLYYSIENAGLPKGMVNRISVGGSPVLDKDKWLTVIAQELAKYPEVLIEIENQIDTTSRVLKTKITSSFLLDVTNDLRLVVYLTEDSIISKQMDYSANPTIVTDYVHRHVLRGAINSTWGDEIGSGGAAIDDIFEKTYTYTIDSLYDAHHCSVVAFIYKYQTKEIIQAEDEEILY